MNMRIALLLSCCMLAMAACHWLADPAQPIPLSLPAHYQFSGQVQRGQTFEHEIGPGLVFRLIPFAQDWEIWIGNVSNAEHNFSTILTPPLHGVNARHIEGWHFRNRDNSGPNEPGAKNVNAPQYERWFCFVLNKADYQVAQEWLAAYQDGSMADQPQLGSAYDRLARGAGLLTIRDLALGNLAGERAWIEQMTFDVDFDLIGGCG